MFKKAKVKTILFLSIALFIIFLFFVVIGVSYRMVVSETIASTSAHQKELLHLYRDELDNQMKVLEETAVVISRNADLQAFINNRHEHFSYNRQRNNLHKYLHQVVLSSSMIDSIDIYMDNPPTFDSQYPIRFLSKIDMHSHPKNKEVNEANEVWLGEHDKHLTEEEKVVSYMCKLYSAKGTLKAMLVLNVRTRDFEALFVDRDHHANQRMLVGKNGEAIMAAHETDEEVGRIVAEHSFNQGGKRELDQGLAVWSALERADWFLVEVTPWGELTKGGKRITAVLIAISLVAIAGALLFALFLSTAFSKPILQLRQGFVQFGKSQKVNVPIGYQNEFGDLFEGFTEMTKEIHALHQSLEEEHRRKNEADITALQANINPHFLYNTLDQLNWMAIAKGQDEISEVIELMGKMLRIGLSKGKSFIPIADELDHIRYYMQIQQCTKSVDISFEIDVPSELHHYYVPKFTLQPIVENAIVHGFHRRQRGMIDISIRPYKQALQLQVKDDGVGFDQKEPIPRKNGYGLQNVAERLRAFFGEEGTITVYSAIGAGTTVLIEIPQKQTSDWGGVNKYVENGYYRRRRASN